MRKRETSRRNVAAMCREYADEAVETLVKGMKSDDLRVARDCANDLLDRAIGKPIAMSANVTDKLDEFTDAELDAIRDNIAGQIASAVESGDGPDKPPGVTH